MLKLKQMEENNDRERKQLENDIEQREKKLEEESRMVKLPFSQVREIEKEKGDSKEACLEFEVSFYS